MLTFSSTRSITRLKGVLSDDTPSALRTLGTLSRVPGTLLFAVVLGLLLWNKWPLPQAVMLFNAREVKERVHA